MKELGELKWFFKHAPPDIDSGNLKDQVLKALKKADGSPVDELERIPIDKIKKLFPKDADFITTENRIKVLMDNLKKDEVFNQIFEVVN